MKQKLLAGITVLWLLLCIPLPARAAPRSVPVTVDDALLQGVAYVEDGVTSIPLRMLCDQLGGWTVSWDEAAQAAVAHSADGGSIVAVAGRQEVQVNGNTYAAPRAVYVRGGRTYVPLRVIAQALGFQVSWNPTLGGAAVTTGAAPSYDATDLYWLSRIISAESRGESLRGQIAVGNVVLNRVAAESFPRTIKNVIFDTKNGAQFEPVSNKTVYDTPSPLSVLAAKAALAGTDQVGKCLYFYAPSLSKGTWIRNNRVYYTTIGCHQFYL